MKIAVQTEKTVTLTLSGMSERETELLAGLSDFPEWDAQEPEVAAFLSTLCDELGEAGYCVSAEDAGYVDATSPSFEHHI